MGTSSRNKKNKKKELKGGAARSRGRHPLFIQASGCYSQKKDKKTGGLSAATRLAWGGSTSIPLSGKWNSGQTNLKDSLENQACRTREKEPRTAQTTGPKNWKGGSSFGEGAKRGLKGNPEPGNSGCLLKGGRKKHTALLTEELRGDVEDIA